MAADRLKRANATSVVGYASREQYKVKKKKVELPHSDLNLRSNISLEWDDKRKNVVSKREQIGIARRDLIPFVGTVPDRLDTLADVFAVPHELFELKDLTCLLTHEVWQTNLNEDERRFLAQFLPKGASEHQLVRDLLSGNNFHFGNPFLEWGASLCSGSCHPDAISRREQGFSSNKRAYYSELRKYHTSMIGNLRMWNERWTTCNNSEEEFMQKILRSRNNVNIPKQYPEQNLGVTSESFSWTADEKTCSSNSPNFTSTNGKNLRRKGLTETKCSDSLDGQKVEERCRKGEKLDKRNIACDDGSKYMSYIKVSKEQHQRVKSSLKQSGNSNQPRSLNHVLGNLNNFSVQPYEVFEEEERQKLHYHWTQVATKNIPAGFKNWVKWQSEKSQVKKSLEQEIREKQKYMEEEQNSETSCNMLLQQTETEASEPGVVLEEEERDKPIDFLLQEQVNSGKTNCETFVTSEGQGEENETADYISQSQAETGVPKEDPELVDVQNNESGGAFCKNQHQQEIAMLGHSHDFFPMDVNFNGNNLLVKSENFPLGEFECMEGLNHAGLVHANPLGSSDVWLAASQPSPYCQHPASGGLPEYVSTGELSSLGHSQVRLQGEPTTVIDLESDLRIQSPGRQSTAGDLFFNACANQDQNELLQQSLIRNLGSSPYDLQRKQLQTRLDFQPTGGISVSSKFPGNLPDLSMPFGVRQNRSSELYAMNRNVRGNMLADVDSQYLIPRQGNFSPLDHHIQDWSVNGTSANMTPYSANSHLNGGDLSTQNWFPGEYRAHDGWPGSVGALGSNEGMQNMSSTPDQSLFSVLSRCNGFPNGVPSYNSSAGSGQQFIQQGDYGGLVGPTRSNVLQGAANALNCFNSHETAASGLRTDGNVGWVTLPHQNAALQDSLNKPFLRSWNQ